MSRRTARIQAYRAQASHPEAEALVREQGVQGGIGVGELDLDGLDGGVLSLTPAPGGPPVGEGEVYVLVRFRGRPVGTVIGRVGPGEDAAEVLAAAARKQLAGHVPPDGRPAPPVRLPRASVVVATRERAGQLARALDSLLAQDHPDYEIVVVDNNPVTAQTRELVEGSYAAHGVRYVREPVPGLAAAHNRGVAVAEGTILAFTDDDVVADPRWLSALAAPFAADPGLGCTTGLILPARLRTPAQILLESHGGFTKGFAPRCFDPARPPADEPLFPFTAGRFGSGANMAFRADALRAVGGFDPATGTGTPARGGDDLYAFARVVVAGHRLGYTPEALVWHHHRETWQDLENQAYGYGAGLTAYLTALLVRRPALLPALLARLPRGLAHARAISAHRDAGAQSVPGEHGAQDYPWPRGLSRLERRGMLYGPVGYLRARRRVRGLRRPWEATR
ncbi:glycosyltransferase family 2 protein [Streptomyces melanogenes]|uniref:Glycosyltransferase n=1 Tax=Streptomyces melanogenes TaxID=67326 RepID=A0ABZ1XL88_9ACTN|nr:glycosyltransferase family 2 protein [Streptomyces melanogenes]